MAAAWLRDELLLVAGGNDDLARILQPPNDFDDLGLHGLNVADALRSGVLHFFLEQLGGPLGQIAQDLLLELVRSPLEGDRPLVIVNLFQDRLNRLVVELEQVVEYELHLDLVHGVLERL